MIAARVISCVLAALGVLAGALLAYVLSTVPVGRVP